MRDRFLQVRLEAALEGRRVAPAARAVGAALANTVLLVARVLLVPDAGGDDALVGANLTAAALRLAGGLRGDGAAAAAVVGERRLTRGEVAGVADHHALLFARADV